ncbi:MAG: radical SAM protein [Planctomycetota bacterium JB042]
MSVCLSSQVGCPVGCRFCASGMDGLVRNLEAHEIVEQLVHARRVDPRVDRLVVMGIGEPLLNAERLFAALETIRTEGGIGPRRMVVSTVGAKGAIRRLGTYGRRVSLALSLHAPDDELRGALIPSMAGASVAELVEDATWYADRIRNKVLAESTLLAGVNDSDDHARRTGALLKGRPIYLNVIPFNRVDGAPFTPPALERARRFVDVVRASGAFATVRKTMGAVETAACGQLRIRASRAGESVGGDAPGRAGARS